jgi:hypothetical protein
MFTTESWLRGVVTRLVRIRAFEWAVIVASVLMIPVAFLVRLRIVSSRLAINLRKAFHVTLAMMVMSISVGVAVTIVVAIIYNLCK